MTNRRSIFFRTAASLSVTAFFLWLAFHGRDLGSLKETLLRQPLLWFIGLFLLQAFSHFLRAIRWRVLLEPVKANVSLHGAFSSLMIGFMVNGIIPRAGELVRAYVLGRREQIPASAVFSTVILERMLDVISFAMVLCLVVILKADSIVFWFPWLEGNAWVLEVFGLAILGGFIFLFIRSQSLFSFLRRISSFFPDASRRKADAFITSLLHGFQAGGNSKNYGIIALLTCTTWFTYIVLLFLPMRLFGMEELSFASAITLQVSNGLASAMPTPGGIGSYHSFIALTLTKVFRVPEDPAIAYVVYTHAIAYVCTLTLGVFYLLRQNIRISELLSAKKEA
jgi:uncharacterized protein (TIRG00374 family)